MKISELLEDYEIEKKPHAVKRQPDYVLGDEVENTIAKGKLSLFITKISDYDEIIQLAKETGAKQLYFEFIHAVRRSQNPRQVIRDFHKAVKHFLDLGYLCGLDTPAEYAEHFVDLHKYKNLINNIAVDLPHVQDYNKNTVFKIRDSGFDQGKPTTNLGPYTMPLDQLRARKHLTPWKKFGPDVTVKPKKNTDKE